MLHVQLATAKSRLLVANMLGKSGRIYRYTVQNSRKLLNCVNLRNRRYNQIRSHQVLGFHPPDACKKSLNFTRDHLDSWLMKYPMAHSAALVSPAPAEEYTYLETQACVPTLLKEIKVAIAIGEKVWKAIEAKQKAEVEERLQTEA